MQGQRAIRQQYIPPTYFYKVKEQHGFWMIIIASFVSQQGFSLGFPPLQRPFSYYTDNTIYSFKVILNTVIR